jgi:shikimate kinase
VACGGGVVLDAERRRLLRERCRVVWLEASPETAAARLAAGGGETVKARPLLAGRPALERLEALLRERAPLYAEAAHVRVPTDGRSPEQVADAVLAALGAS